MKYVFEKKNDDMILGNAMSTYLSHPAFWNNLDNDNVVDENELLAGIWVGKFETTAVYKKDENDVSFSLGVAWPLVLPDIVGNNCFLEGDCHIIETIFRDTGVANMDRSYLKSSGWGAVAYLSHSEYGINEEIRTNNTQITGCGAKSDRILERPSDCSNDIAYGSGVSEYPQSTTGNISGIFDMAGGVWEYVEPSELEPIFEENNWPTMIDTLCNGEKCYGHALFETVNWYDDSFELRSLASESSEIKLYRGGGIDYPDKGLSNNSNDGIFSISAIMAESRGKNPRLTLIEIND